MRKFRKLVNILAIFTIIFFEANCYSSALRVPFDKEYNRVIVLQKGKFLSKKAIKLSSLSSEDREKFGNALLEMVRHVSSHRLILANYASLILENKDFPLTEIYAAVDERGGEWGILALQIVNFKDLEEKEAVLSTWIKSDRKVSFVANQILAFAIADLLNRGVEKVDSSHVAYTERVRRYLPIGINDVTEMKTFLRHNAIELQEAINRKDKNLRKNL